MSEFPVAPGLGSLVSELCVSPEIMRILDDAEEKINKEDIEKNKYFNENEILIQIKDFSGRQSNTIRVDTYTNIYELKEIIGSNMNIPVHFRNKIIILNDLSEINQINNQNLEKPKIFVIYFILGVCSNDKASRLFPTKTVNGGKKGNKSKKSTRVRNKNKKQKTKRH
jgi:hypothetical protein